MKQKPSARGAATAKPKRETVRQRLAQQRPEVEARRQVNWNTARERQRRTLAANAQALHDRYESDITTSPHMDGLRLASVAGHKDQLRRLLSEMNSFQDPRMGLPAY